MFVLMRDAHKLSLYYCSPLETVIVQAGGEGRKESLRQLN